MHLKLAIAVLLIGSWAEGQTTPPGPASRNEPVTIRTSVQLVTIPVVVRNKQGRAVGNLEKTDFELFDNGKPQEISLFSVEKSGDANSEPPAAPQPAAPRQAIAPTPARPAPEIVPGRFVGYLFDDIHIKASDLIRVRKAAAASFASSLGPGDRGAVFTTSGVVTVDFTSDRDELQKALLRLMPRSMAGENQFACPQIGYYQADLIANKKDPMAIRTAIAEIMGCDPSTSAEQAVNKADYEARLVLAQGEREGRAALSSFLDVVRHMEVLPGERTLILLSPGFLIADLRRDVSQIIHTAIQARVTVSALDARGLWSDPTFDASVGHQGGASPARSSRGMTMQGPGGLPSGADIARNKSFFISSAALVAADVMAEISAGTGGRLFENSNDLKRGLQQIAAAPEFVYMLTFSPREVKIDGKYHNVKVTVTKGDGLTVDARKGYYAPVRFSDPVEQAKDAMREAVFSRDELNDMPVEVTAELVKKAEQTAQIVAQARFYPQTLKLRKADGRHYGQVRMICSVFDPNGQYVKAVEKVLQLQIRDDLFERASQQGLAMRVDVDVKPGKYLVRVVIRDVDGQQTAARNLVVEEARIK
jgi:VWFA-related protein